MSFLGSPLNSRVRYSPISSYFQTLLASVVHSFLNLYSFSSIDGGKWSTDGRLSENRIVFGTFVFFRFATINQPLLIFSISSVVICLMSMKRDTFLNPFVEIGAKAAKLCLSTQSQINCWLRWMRLIIDIPINCPHSPGQNVPLGVKR